MPKPQLPRNHPSSRRSTTSQPPSALGAELGTLINPVNAFNDRGWVARDIYWLQRLAGVDALVMPGGESTTMSKLLVTSGLFEPIAEGAVGKNDILKLAVHERRGIAGNSVPQSTVFPQQREIPVQIDIDGRLQGCEGAIDSRFNLVGRP